MVTTPTACGTSLTAGPTSKPLRPPIEEAVARCAAGGSDAIARRLEELDREWDAERALEATAAATVLVGVVLGATLDSRILVLPALAGGFLLLHALGGWCPPSLLGRRGRRSAAKINEERYALKSLRGDFQGLLILTPAEDRADLARFEGEGGVISGPDASDAHDQHDRAAVTEALDAARQ